MKHFVVYFSNIKIIDSSVRYVEQFVEYFISISMEKCMSENATNGEKIFEEFFQTLNYVEIEVECYLDYSDAQSRLFG